MKNNIYLKEMGKRVKTIRKAKKITLDQFSKMSGLDVSNISLLENGKRNPHLLTLKNIADKLNVDIMELITRY